MRCTFPELIRSLELTRKSSEKKAILKEQMTDDTYRLFQLALDPFVTFGVNISKKQFEDIPLSKFLDEGSYNSNDIDARMLMCLTAIIKAPLGSKNRTGIFVTGCRFFRRRDAEIFARIVNKDLKCGVGVKLFNNAMEELGKSQFPPVPVFEVQLAESYDPDKDYGVEHWFTSRKMNGLRGYYDAEQKKILSREGHEYIGFTKLSGELERLCEKYNLEFCDGELFSYDLPFQKIQSIVRKEYADPTKELISLHIFAIKVKGREWESSEEMVDFLWDMDWQGFELVDPVQYHKVLNDPRIIRETMNVFHTYGYEGLMLRRPDLAYSYGRSTNLLKLKPFKEEDFEIIDVLPGKPGTVLENTLGAIQVQGKIDGHCVKSKVGSGFLMKSPDGKQYLDWNGGDWGPGETPTRDWMWHNRDKLIGLKAEIAFQELTDGRKGVADRSLTFPTFVKLKLDR